MIARGHSNVRGDEHAHESAADSCFSPAMQEPGLRVTQSYAQQTSDCSCEAGIQLRLWAEETTSSNMSCCWDVRMPYQISHTWCTARLSGVLGGPSSQLPTKSAARDAICQKSTDALIQTGWATDWRSDKLVGVPEIPNTHWPSSQ